MAQKIRPYLFSVVILAFLPAAAAAESVVKLYCARDVASVRDAEMQLRGKPPHVVNVTFSGTLPAKIALDHALRDCLSTAIKLDASTDILVLAWHRSGAGLERLNLYDDGLELFYRQARKSIGLQKAVSAPPQH